MLKLTILLCLLIQPVFADLSKKFDQTLEAHGVDNALLIVLDKKEKIVLKKAKGNSNLTSPIAIASSTKWITAAIALRLLRKNQIPLDKKIESYLPNHIRKKISESKRNTSFRDLLSFQSRMTGKFICPYSPFRWMNTKKCSEKMLIDSDYQNEAGFEYGHIHMMTLGYLLERIEGKSWNEIFESEFKSFFDIKNQEVKYYASPKKRRGEQNPLIPGGLVIAPSDYLKFLKMLWNKGAWNGKKYLSAKDVSLLHRDQFPNDSFKVYSTPYANLGVNPHYAFGNWVEKRGQINSSGGAFGMYPWIDWKNQYIGLYVTLNSPREAQRSFKIVDSLRSEIEKLIQN